MMRFSVHNGTAFSMALHGREEMLHVAALMERLGNYTMISVMDHVNWYPDYTEIYAAWPMVAELAAVTRQLDVGIIVTDPFRTHPVQAAQNAVHLQKMLGARRKFVLGMGAGEGPNLQAWGIDASKPVSRLEEAVQVFKQLVTSNPKAKRAFEGKHHSYAKQFLQFKRSAAEEVPVPALWVAGCSPRTARITAAHADGWIPVGFTPDLYATMAREITAASPGIEPALNIFASVSKTDPDGARARIKHVGAVQCLRPGILAACGIDVPPEIDFIKHFKAEKVSDHKRHQGKALEFVMERGVPEEVLLSTVLAGNPDEVVGQLERFRDAGCKHACIQFMGETYREMVELFSTAVIPHLATEA